MSRLVFFLFYYGYDVVREGKVLGLMFVGLGRLSNIFFCIDIGVIVLLLVLIVMIGE